MTTVIGMPDFAARIAAALDAGEEPDPDDLQMLAKYGDRLRAAMGIEDDEVADDVESVVDDDRSVVKSRPSR